MCRNISTKDINAAIRDYYPDYNFYKTSSISNGIKVHMINKKYLNLDLTPAGLECQISAPYLSVSSEDIDSPFILWIEKIFTCDFLEVTQHMHTYLSKTFMDTAYMVHQLIDELYKIYKTGRVYCNTISFIQSMIEM